MRAWTNGREAPAVFSLSDNAGRHQNGLRKKRLTINRLQRRATILDRTLHDLGHKTLLSTSDAAHRGTRAGRHQAGLEGNRCLLVPDVRALPPRIEAPSGQPLN